jgi:hypothetical protein
MFAKLTPYNRDYRGRHNFKTLLHNKGFVAPVEGEGEIAGGEMDVLNTSISVN